MEPNETFLTLHGGLYDGRLVSLEVADLRASREEGIAIFTRRFLESLAVRFETAEWRPGEEVLIYRWSADGLSLEFTGEVGIAERYRPFPS